MFSSRYSIHDLSRGKGEGDSNLARFNMPLELGFAMPRPDAPLAPFPDAVIKRLPAFQKELERLRTKSGGELPWSDTILTARKHAKSLSKRVASEG